jgi:hypothetical protein
MQSPQDVERLATEIRHPVTGAELVLPFPEAHPALDEERRDRGGPLQMHFDLIVPTLRDLVVPGQ